MATRTEKARIGYAEGRAVFQQFKEAIFLRLSDGATLRAIQTELAIPLGYHTLAYHVRRARKGSAGSPGSSHVKSGPKMLRPQDPQGPVYDPQRRSDRDLI